VRFFAASMALFVGWLLLPGGAHATTATDARVIVQWAPGADRGDRAEARAEAGVDFERTLGDRDFQTVEADSGQSLEAAVATLEADPAVLVAEPDGWSSPQAPPNDPLFGQLWGLRNPGGSVGVGGFPLPHAGADIDVLGAWLRTVGTPSTVVAVIDSGYHFGHPDLAPVAWTNAGEIAGNGQDDEANGYVDDRHGYDFVGADADAPVPDADPTDDDYVSGGHGVHVAGTVGAKGDNGVGIVGVAQDVRLMPLRVCSFRALGDGRCLHSAMIAAINYAGANGARAANISIGGNAFSQAMVNAIAANSETLFVISAGNDRMDAETIPPYPCAYQPTEDADPPVSDAVDNVVCVAATDQADRLAGFSNYGAVSVDLGAPGTETLSADVASNLYSETFEADGFDARWAATGPDGGFARSATGRLTSFGKVDSPNAVVQSTSAPVALPAGFGGCTYRQQRTGVAAAGGAYTYAILLDGEVVFESDPDADSGEASSGPIAGLSAGGSVRIRHTHSSGADPIVGNGVWVDDLRLRCFEAPGSTAATFGFKQGTSMAAPHVTGVAALLFSQRPGAAVTEVRQALLGRVDPLPALADKTVTGGRLNASRAVDAFDSDAPPAPQLAIVPNGPANDNAPRITGTAEERSRVALHLGGACAGAPIAIDDAAQLAAPGIAVTVADNTTTTFSATATDSAGNESGCSEPVSYTEATPAEPPVAPPPVAPPPVAPPPVTLPPVVAFPPAVAAPIASVERCRVPRLARLPLRRARVALRKASCALGKVTRPKRGKGQRKLQALVVRSSRPRAGAERTARAKVAVKLGPRPKRKPRQRR
jgi:subtilisin family serine protease